MYILTQFKIVFMFCDFFLKKREARCQGILRPGLCVQVVGKARADPGNENTLPRGQTRGVQNTVAATQ